MGATVLSRMEYGLHMTLSSSETSMTRLERVQNSAMRIVTGAAKPTSCEALRYWLGILSIKEQQQLLAVKAFMKALQTPSHPLHEELNNRSDKEMNQRLKTVQSWAREARSIVEKVCP